MSKYDIPPQFECQNTIFGQISNVKIGFQMSKYGNWPQYECQNRILNENMKFGLSLNVKIGF